MDVTVKACSDDFLISNYPSQTEANNSDRCSATKKIYQRLNNRSCALFVQCGVSVITSIGTA